MPTLDDIRRQGYQLLQQDARDPLAEIRQQGYSLMQQDAEASRAAHEQIDATLQRDLSQPPERTDLFGGGPAPWWMGLNPAGESALRYLTTPDEEGNYGYIGGPIMALERARLRGKRSAAGFGLWWREAFEMQDAPRTEEYRQEIRELDSMLAQYRPSESAQTPLSEGGWANFSWYSENLTETLAVLGSQILLTKGAGMAGLGPRASVALGYGGTAFANETGNLYADARMRGVDPGTASFEALTVGGMTAALDLIPGHVKFIPPGSAAARVFETSAARNLRKNFFARASMGFIAEGGTEAAQDAWSDVVQYLAENDPNAFQGALDRYGQSFILGGVAGGVLGSPGKPAETAQPATEAAPAPTTTITPAPTQEATQEPTMTERGAEWARQNREAAETLQGGPQTRTPFEQATGIKRTSRADREAFMEGVAQASQPTAPKVSEADIRNIFPGAQLNALQGGEGWNVQFDDGQSIDVRFVDRVQIDWDQVRNADQLYPKQFRQQIEAAGQFSVTGANGYEITGEGLILLSKSLATKEVAQHEALHAARSLGFFTESEWKALEEGFVTKENIDRLVSAGQLDPLFGQQALDPNADFDARDSAREEVIAVSREAWGGSKGLRSRISAYFHKLLNTMGLGKLTAEDVSVLTTAPGFWRRPRSTAAVPGTKLSASMLSGRQGELANPSVPEDVRTARDEMYGDLERPEGERVADWSTEAQRRLDEDFDGQERTIRNKLDAGVGLDKIETLVANKIFDARMQEALQSGDTDAYKKLQEWDRKYHWGRTELARSMVAGRDPLATPRENRKSTLNRALAATEDMGKAIDLLKKRGIDITNLDELSRSIRTTQKAMNQLRSMVPRSRIGKAYDMVYEFWRNSILSGIKTFIVNTASTGFTVANLTEHLVEGFAADLARMGGKEISDKSLADFKYMFRGTAPTFGKALANAIATWDMEQSQFNLEHGITSIEKMEGYKHAIPGKVGRVVRIPFRMLGFTDDFVKTFDSYMTVGMFAHQLARKEGLRGDALTARIDQLVADHNSPAWGKAIDFALYTTFQNEGGKVAQSVSKAGNTLRQHVPPLGFILPFVQTPVNLLGRGLERSVFSPLTTLSHFLELRHDAHKALHEGKGDGSIDWTKLTPDMVRTVMAFGSVLALALTNDEEDPWITGAVGYSDRTIRELGRSEGLPPAKSIKLFGTWYNYGRIDPFATLLSINVDLANAAKRPGAGRLAGDSWESLRSQVMDKTYLSGLSDLFEIVGDSGISREAGAKWISRFTTSFIPNIYRDSARSSRPVRTQQRVWGDDETRSRMWATRLYQETQLPGGAPRMPVVDRWGRDVYNDGPNSNLLFRIISPVRTQGAEPLPVDRALWNWQAAHPRDEDALKLLPVARGPDYRYQGETHYMTDEQYYEFTRLAGQVALQLTDGLAFDPENPTREDIELIKGLVGRADNYVLDHLRKEWHEGVPADMSVESVARAIRGETLRQMRDRLSTRPPRRRAGETLTAYQYRRQQWEERREQARTFLSLAG